MITCPLITPGDLLTRVSRIQQPGSPIAFGYWKPDTMEYPAMVRSGNFFNREFGERGTGRFLYDKQLFRDIPGYVLRERTDIAGLDVQYFPTGLFQAWENKIPAHFGVLEQR